MIDLTDGIEESDKKESANRFFRKCFSQAEANLRAKAEAVALSCGLTSAQ